MNAEEADQRRLGPSPAVVTQALPTQDLSLLAETAASKGAYNVRYVTSESPRMSRDGPTSSPDELSSSSVSPFAGQPHPSPHPSPTQPHSPGAATHRPLPPGSQPTNPQQASPAQDQPTPKISAEDLALLTENAQTKTGTYQCALCNKQFGYKNGLIRHLRLTHVGEKPYQCNICQRRFGYKHILMEHQNLHFGNRPYACNMCDKRFAARSNLIQHRMVHKRPFHCSLCNKRFDKEDQLKKHLYAHPQSLLQCNICKYAATSQADLNKHMFDAHRPQVVPPRSTSPPSHSSCNDEQPQVNGGEEFHDERPTEPITPPENGEQPMSPGGLPPGMPLSLYAALQSQYRGQRIDAICTQLGTTRVHCPPHLLANFEHGYPGVIVKKEFPGEGGGCYETRADTSPRPPYSDAMECSTAGPSSAEPARTHVSSPHAMSTTPITAVTPTMVDERQQPLTSALPGIHEVFSRRSQKLPPTLTSFGVPTLLTADNRMTMNIPHPDMTRPMMSPPLLPPFPTPTTSSSQRPTAQLPPITQVLKQTKDQAVQHSAPIPGFPLLEDVLSYYMSQGKLFKCQYCHILFFERGMYFLHASLHGPSSPWECSICHKICSDKNEFTLHFVNQQHNC